VRHALRSSRRIRFLRGALLIVAVLLVGVVAWEIWSNRPRRKPAQAPPPAVQPENATQTLDKFEYTATAMGKLAYRILADKLTGVEGGLHTLQTIRRAEFKLSDGPDADGGADRGTFTTGARAAARRRRGVSGGQGRTKGSVRDTGVVLEGHVVVWRSRRAAERPHRVLQAESARFPRQVPLPPGAAAEDAGNLGPSSDAGA
jgi:hypothetical protein